MENDKSSSSKIRKGGVGKWDCSRGSLRSSNHSGFQIPDSGPRRPVQIPDSRFQGQDLTDPKGQCRFHIPDSGDRISQIPHASTDSSFQESSARIGGPWYRFQVPVSRVPVSRTHQHRFQFPDSKGNFRWTLHTSTDSRFQTPKAGPAVRYAENRIQVPVSRLGPVSRFQYPDYRIQGGWRGRSGRGRLQIQIRRFWGGRGGAGTEKQGTDSRIRASLGTSQNSRFQALSLHPKS